MANVFFKKGLLANLPASYTAGTFYVTTDERAMYLDIDDSTRIRLGDFIQVDAVANLPTAGASTSALYYCVAENILAKWNGAAWTQINKQPTADEMKTLLGLGTMAYKSEVVEGDLNTDLAAKINAASGAQHTHDNKSVLDGITAEKVADWDDAVSKEHTHSFADEAAISGITAAKVADWDDAVSKEHTHTFVDTDVVDAISKKHAHTFNETELNKIVEGDVARWNAVVSDHLTSADRTALENSIKEAKKAGTDANTNIETYKVTNDARVLAIEEDVAEIIDGTNGILAQAKSYSDGKLATARTEISAEIDGDVKVVNDALEAYKTANNEALAGVKATADAAAVKTEVETALSSKVDKTSYEADKATFAIAETVNAEIAKKANTADVVANTTFESFKTTNTQAIADAKSGAISEIEAKGYAVATEVAGTYATKTELGNVDKKFENYVTSASYATDKSATETALANRYTKEEADGKFALITDAYDDSELVGRVSDAEGKIADLETESAKHATKDELAGVDAKFADYTKTSDLPTDLGDFTNNAGYAKTADVNAELDKKADKTQVEADIAAAVAPLATTEALNGVKATAEAATTVEEVDAQIDAKITALNLGTTYEPIGAEQRAKDYVDGKFTDADLGQYTTEQDVKDIVDTVIAGAVDGDTITGLANLVEYLNTHGAEAKEMGAAIDVLEGKVETIEGKPAYGITATQISNWDGEVGAKALAETKLDATTFTEYSNAHAGDYTNKQIDDAIDADVASAIEAEVARANAAYDTKGDAAKAQAAAEATASSALATARTEITTEIGTAISGEVSRADGKYEEKGVAQGIIDGLKLGETYEPIGAEARAIAAAEGKVNALAATVYTQAEVDAAIEAAVTAACSWSEF